MRAVLLRIIVDPLWMWEVRDGVPHIGLGYMLIPWCLVAAGVWWWSRRTATAPGETLVTMGMFAAAPIFALLARDFLPDEGLPIFGYGFMMFMGILAATGVSLRNARLAGLNREVIFDASLWLIIPGIIGARVFYLIQYREQVLGGKRGMEWVRAAINLPDGGLVFFGCIIAGLIGFSVYCYRRRLNLLLMSDIVLPGVIMGLACGRIGCFLYGCCFGDRCELPWAVQFPQDSVPFKALVNAGFLPETAAASLPLHPTQLYSSINAFLLATVLMLFFSYRPRNGAVLAAGWIAYPMTRFILEFLRGDEMGQFGTDFTISQHISLVLFGTGVVYALLLTRFGDRPALAGSHAPAAG